MAVCRLQQEENTDRYTLEDGTGVLLLEDCAGELFEPTPGEILFTRAGRFGTGARRGRIVPTTPGGIG